MTLQLDRERVIAHRLVAQSLATPERHAVACGLLGLGIQDTPAGSGRVALAARTVQPVGTELFDESGQLAVVMASRGAPHVVSRAELPLLSAALFPLDEREAAGVDEVAQAMREIAKGKEVSRPGLSEALNDKVADSLRAWCDRCKSRHVREGLFRKASLQAGLELVPRATSPAMFRPSGVHRSALPDPKQAGAELVRRYIHFTGVARPADVAFWLGYKTGEITTVWNLIAEELTRCEVAGRRRWALTSDVQSLSHAPRPHGVRLLPPFDPYLLGGRALVVPERDHQRQLWRAQASPGAILVNGDVVGAWRQRKKGNRLQLTLYPFHRLDAMAMKDVVHAAETIARLRDVPETDITIDIAE